MDRYTLIIHLPASFPNLLNTLRRQQQRSIISTAYQSFFFFVEDGRIYSHIHLIMFTV